MFGVAKNILNKRYSVSLYATLLDKTFFKAREHEFIFNLICILIVSTF